MLLLLDNYDSFVHNLARHFRRLGQETVVVRNDAIGWQGVKAMRPDAIVISPGPCTPAEAGCSVDVVRELADDFPILGVCLGHQAIAAALGTKIVRARDPMHGRASEVHHNGEGLFRGVPSPLSVCRYHSLVIDDESLSVDLEAIARAADGAIMAIAHRRQPVVGVQFHPEAVLTEHGYAMLANFLRIAGMNVSDQLPEGEVMHEAGDSEEVDWPLPGGRIANDK